MSEALGKARAAKAARAREYATSIIALADANGIDVETYQGNGRAIPSMREVRIPEVRGIVAYYVALHEIGHIVGRGRSAPKLECEANAWQWALDHAMTPPSPAVEKKIRRCLRSYYDRHCRMARRRYVRFPEPDHSFWRLTGIEPHDQWSIPRNAAR